MFEQITIHRGLQGVRFDLGQLAETLLFYKSNLLLLDRGSLIGAVNALGEDGLLRIVDEFGVKLSYHRENFGTLTDNNQNVDVNKFTQFTADGTKEKKIKSTNQEIEDVVMRQLGSSRKSRRFVRDLIERTASKSLKREECISLVNAAQADILDKNYSNYAARIAISVLAPGFTPDGNFFFSAIDLGENCFSIDTNLNFTG